MPESWNEHYRKTHDWFYCPAGHQQHYTGETEAERLKRQVAQLQTTIERKEAYEQTLRNEVREQRLKCAAVRGVVTKIKRRIYAGVCPCCNRTFQNLARHMHTQHPEQVPSTTIAQ